MPKITNVSARQVINALWSPTVEVTVEVDGKYYGKAVSPSGTSTGKNEARELRDGGKQYGGAGCSLAVQNVQTEIRDLLMGLDVTNQRKIDRLLNELDGTPNKARLGANAIVATSAAVAVAAANALHLPLYRYLNSGAKILPVPFLSTIDGGHLAFGASSEIQEFNTFPIGADTFSEALDMSRNLHFTLYEMFSQKFGPLSVLANPCGSFSIPCKSARETFGYLMEAIEKCGYSGRIVLGMDCASSHWYDPEQKLYRFEGALRTKEEMAEIYKSLIEEFPIVSVEDPFSEDDVQAYAEAEGKFGNIQLVGDDFFVTNPGILKERLKYKSVNAMLWKYNQIGTLTEAFDAAEIAFRSGYGVMTSERTGESEDTILSDLTVAIGAGQMKTGTLTRTEHVGKYNRLQEIEAELGADGVFAGLYFRNGYLR